MLRDSAYQGGRIQQEELNSNDCAVKITDIQEFENGTWECSVTVKDSNDNFDIGVGHIEVIVALPPDNAYMTFENEKILENITVNLDEQKEIVTSCVAVGGSVKPEFKWYIGDEVFSESKLESKEKNGTIIYNSVRKFNLSMEQNEEVLKCEIVHKGYNIQQLKAGINLIETQLNLNFKASFSEPEVEGNTVKISFKCNPEPTGGQWIIEDGLIIPFGEKNGTFQASEIFKVDGKNQYEAKLNHTLNEKKTANIEVVNDLGITLHYSFEIGAYNKLIVVILHLIPLILILVVIIAVIYLLYRKKFLCFKERKEKGSSWDEEKADSSMSPLIKCIDAADGTKRKIDTQNDIVDFTQSIGISNFKAEENPMLETEAKSKSNAEDKTEPDVLKTENDTKSKLEEETKSDPVTISKPEEVNVKSEPETNSQGQETEKIEEKFRIEAIENDKSETKAKEANDKAQSEIEDSVEPQPESNKIEDISIIVDSNLTVLNADDQQNNTKSRKTKPVIDIKAATSWRPSAAEPETATPMLPDTPFSPEIVPLLPYPLKAPRMPNKDTKPEENLDDIMDSISSMAIMPEKKVDLEADGNAKSETKDLEEQQPVPLLKNPIKAARMPNNDNKPEENIDPNLTVPNADGQQNNSISRKSSFNSDHSSGSSNVSQTLVYYCVC